MDIEIGTVLNPLKLGERNFNPNDLYKAIGRSVKVWSWGAHAWTAHKEKFLRFKVNGHHHKGHVYITLAFNDTFTIYYTTTRGKVISIDTDIYIDMLIDSIDGRVEYIETYKDN